MKNRCVVSCCYAASDNRKEYYTGFAERLLNSLDVYDKDSDRIVWRDSWPPDSPSHSEHHYALKWFAVEAARKQGYRYIMWLDAGCKAVDSIEPFWERIAQDGYLLIEGEDKLGAWISDQALAYFKTDRDAAMEMRLLGGCCVGLDMQSAVARRFFDWWGELARTSRLFMCAHLNPVRINEVMRSVLVQDGDENLVISTDSRVQGHRSDEACFSLMTQALGMRTMPVKEWMQRMVSY